MGVLKDVGAVCYRLALPVDVEIRIAEERSAYSRCPNFIRRHQFLTLLKANNLLCKGINNKR